jgi:tetratricopeptide (TPR) repeat protein
MRDFFISYNKADYSWAEWIAWQLEEAGYTTVIQVWDFRPGFNFVLEMQKAAIEAKRTIAVLSPNYLSATFTQPEWAAAFAQDPTGEKGTLVPVRVRECKLEGLLSQVTYIDLVGLNEQDAKEELLRGVGTERAKPISAPAFPADIQVIMKPRFPGSLPVVWNVPYVRNINFTGQDEPLTNLYDTFSAAMAQVSIQVIHGLGGIGKTHMAVEYAYRHSVLYEVVWWVRAEDSVTLNDDLTRLARRLELPEKDAKDQQVTIDAVRLWLGRNRDWLLIFDNADEPRNLRNYLPQGGHGHIIITSQNPNWRGVGSTVPLAALHRTDSISFLRKRTGLDDENLGQLAETLGDLPLALEQAGAYIEETGKSVTEYLDLFQVYQQELLDRASPSADYPLALRAAWEITIRKVEEVSPTAARLLAILSFLAPDIIPRSLFDKCAEITLSPEQRGNQLALDDAVATLRRFSLIEVAKDNFSVHRLVQAVIRERLTHYANNLAAGAVGLINTIFPMESDDVRNWSVCSSLLPHAMAAIRYAETLGSTYNPVVELLNKIATYFIGRADYKDAKRVLEKALDLTKRLHGEESAAVADILSNLGVACIHLSDNQTALLHLNKALSISERAYGREDESVANALNNIAMVLNAEGKLDEAIEYYQRALGILEAKYGTDNLLVATVLDNVGGVLIKKYDVVGAQESFTRAINITESHYGSNHPLTSRRLNNLGNVYAAVGRFSEALEYAQRALSIEEPLLGSNHPSVAIARLNVGITLRELKDFEGARKEITQAVQVLRARLGESHPDTIKAQRILNGLP